MSQNKTKKIDALGHLSAGKRTRLHRLLYQFGPGRGTMLVLPYDQGLEHGPIDFLENPDSGDPDHILSLAIEGGFSGVALHLGLAEKYYPRVAGRIPLILKLNGKTSIPEKMFSTLTGTIEDAIRLGADAVGYTLYVGSPDQDQDIRQFREVRQEAERFGLPVIVWAYPRGRAVDARGGKDGLYAVDYAARTAEELGADAVKVNPPARTGPGGPAPYADLDWDAARRARKVVESAGRCLVLFSGGEKVGDRDLLDNARLLMGAGATGLIFGRNFWQRPWNDALAMAGEVREILLAHGES
ncbi:MAG: fructose-bisphosphate aldolase [Planctomycetes bacterium]|nr:fructose-bisphosphate aldolase [Planctomycetota bacterium]